MRQLKLSLASIAFVLGITAAFAFKPAETTSGSGSSYYWFQAGSSTSYMGQNTTGDEQTVSGCETISTPCEDGYTSSQLINPAVPSQGVKPGELPQQQIFRD